MPRWVVYALGALFPLMLVGFVVGMVLIVKNAKRDRETGPIAEQPAQTPPMPAGPTQPPQFGPDPEKAPKKPLPGLDSEKGPLGPARAADLADPDSAAARSQRWILRFRTQGGRDYVAQLAAVGASVLIPLPPENRRALIIPDLTQPGSRRQATDADIQAFTSRIRLRDARPDSVRSVLEALGVKEPATVFWTCFPKAVEEDLARKEVAYRNRRPVDIAETIFRAHQREGRIDFVVDDQSPKK